MAGFYLASRREGQRLRRHWSIGAAGILGPVPGSHRYWRLLITANDGSGLYNGFTEVDLRGVAGGADLTVNPGTPFSSPVSGSSWVNTDNHPYLGCDNNLSTGWLTANASFPAWWEYDFGFGTTPPGPQIVAQVVITGSHNVPAASPRDFQLQWSDDRVTWTTVMSVTGQTGWAGATDVRVFTV